MLLATPADIRSAFGPDEVAALVSVYDFRKLPVEARTMAEDEVLLSALKRASSEAASYLAWRYSAFRDGGMPKGIPMPAVIVGVVCDIARYHLTGSGVTPTEAILARYTGALDWLQRIATGAAALPGFEEAADCSGGTRIVSHTRRFCRATTGQQS